MMDFLYPELGMPLLAGVARHAGLRTEQRDLNVELVNHRFASASSILRVLEHPGWRAVLAGPGHSEADLAGTAGKLSELFSTQPPVRRALFSRLSEILSLQPPGTGIEEILAWARRDHEQYDSFLGDSLDDLLSRDPPAVAGLSVCSASQIGPAIRIALHLKRAGVSHVVVGGPWAKASATLLDRWPELFEVVDSVATSDGERTLPALVRAVLDGRDPAGLPGLAVWRSGTLVRGHDPVPVLLQDLPDADFGGLSLDRYENRWLPVRSRRTCPWGRCIFCHHVLEGEDLAERALPAGRVVDRMGQLMSMHGVNVFEMANLSTPASEMAAIADGILARGLDLRWLSLVRIERGFTREVLEKLARSGCVELQFGLESISDDDLVTVNKGIRRSDVERLLDAAAGVGIRVNLFVLNFPGQREKDFVETLEFCRAHHDVVNNFPVQRFTLSRTSGAFRDPSLLGLTIDPASERDLDVFDVPFTAAKEVARHVFMRHATHHTLLFRQRAGGSTPSFWDVQGIVSRLGGSKPTQRGPLRLLLVRASLPGARIRGNEPPPIAPPLGVLYLASAVKNRSRHAHHVAVSDLGMDTSSPSELFGLLAGHAPDVVGISANNVDRGILHRIARTAKILDPACTVVVGGAITTAIGEELLQDPFIDVLALSEGEQTLPELLDTMAEGGDLRQVAGLVLRGPDGSPTRTKHRAFIGDLDTLDFPDWSLLKLGDYSKLCNCNEFPIQAKVYAPIFTSRGCPWRCIFCHNHFGRKARTRSAANVLDEMQLLVEKHRVRELHIHDDIFNIDGQRLVDICDGIIERRLDIRIAFPNGVRADRLTPLHLEKLAAAGCYHMCMAFETVTPRLQKMIRKNLDVHKVLENARRASELGIVTACFVMLGFPTETRDELMATIETVARSHFDYMRLFVACPHPNTALYDLAVQHGFDPETLPPRRFEYDWDRTMVNCTSLADDEFRDLTQLAQERFLTNPARVERLRRIHERFDMPLRGEHLSHGVLVDL